jgi:RNA polymerase sigma factor (TIGR02999 family)
MDDIPTSPDDDAERTHHVTLALHAARGGDPAALNEAFQLVYAEVRAIARARVARFGVGSTLDTTAVVHEAYLKLARHGEMAWADRQHFLAVASAAMRQVLLDHARRHLSLKRGAAAPPTSGSARPTRRWTSRRATSSPSTPPSPASRPSMRSSDAWSSCGSSAA